jgi:predicted RNA polymerase sigma factor
VEQIAGAFLMAPAAMEQQITRAKRTIAKVGVEFDTPDRQDENLFPAIVGRETSRASLKLNPLQLGDVH